MPIQLQKHLVRFSAFYREGDPAIPPELCTLAPEPRAIPPAALPPAALPLPSRRRDYTCRAATRDGVVWYGAKTGLTRYDPGAKWQADRVMFFSAKRDLPGNEILALLPAPAGDEDVYEALWVHTNEGAALITMRWMTCEEKANRLLRESVDVVDRRGMFSQRWLTRPRDLSSGVPYNESDNDGCFGCGFALAELFHYAVKRRELGPDHPETRRVRAISTRASEAMLLLCYMPQRGDGFVARTYLAPHEPIPDGFFFRKLGDGTAQVVDTKSAVEKSVAGKIIDCSSPIPERLARLYKDENIGEAGIVYKGDTSSDEITLHFVHFLYLSEILGKDDPELAALNIQACENVMAHILDHGCEMHDAFGEPTTWAKWSERYFKDGFGWFDASLNSAEILMYLRVTMAVTGETGRWQAAYDELLAKGYAELGQHHAERLEKIARIERMDVVEFIMFGDHMLATAAFWPLILLEPDPELRKLYRAGYKSWRGSVAREHNPGFDIPFLLACPEEPVDMAMLEHWFYRSPASRLATGVSLENRVDVPLRLWKNKKRETGCLLADDERFIAKYNRTPYLYNDSTSGSERMVDSCYPYTFAYWLGRYYGVVE